MCVCRGSVGGMINDDGRSFGVVNTQNTLHNVQTVCYRMVH